MTDSTVSLGPARRLWVRADKAVVTIAIILMVLGFFDPEALRPTLRKTADSFAHTLPFIAFAVFAVGFLKASGAERLLARAFEGHPARMILYGALIGGLSPFCSCEVIPFVAALLAVGVPLSAVMAFWLASPLMDPAMFAITAGTLGVDFALAKTVAAIALGVAGGTIVLLARATPVFADPLRETPQIGGCCSAKQPFSGQPLWRFWTETERRETFRKAVVDNTLFLGKWLLLAYLLEAMMLRYVPAEWIAQVLGGGGIGPILLGALVGAPAYLNGYAAVPLIGGLLQQGMSPGAAMSFIIAGGVSSIPAAVAVWALVKPRVFCAYILIALVGAVLAGLAWSMIS